MASCCLFMAIFSGCKEPESRPNIILVLADDQGWGDMAYNGHPVLKTPNFDDMAKTGLRFDRFYSAAPVCSPTRGSIMTGRHPNRFGCFQWGNTLRPQEKTLAESLKEAGYITGHFGKWHLGPVFKDSPLNPGNSGFDEWLSAPNFFDNDPILSREGTAVQLEGESSMVTVDAALEFINKHKDSSRPFFAWICFGSPHVPHIAVEQDRKLYEGQEERFQHYYGEITGMDRAFGKLRQRLKEFGIAENTLLWYVSDNGGFRNFGSTGGRGVKGMIYEGGLRVPSLLEWPARIKEHRIVNMPCNTSDFFPTFLEIAGAEIKNHPVLDGTSLVPLIEGKARTRNKPMGFWQYPARGVTVPSQKIMAQLLVQQQSGEAAIGDSLLLLNAGEIKQQYPEDILPGHAAWLNWPHKLHRIQDSTGITFELYNLEADSMETTNLAEKNPDLVKSMKDELEAWQVSVIHSLNGKDYQTPSF